MNRPSKGESIQDALKIIRYTLEGCISLYGPVKPDQESGYVAQMRAEVLKNQSFEDVQVYFTLLQAYKLIDSVTA